MYLDDWGSGETCLVHPVDLPASKKAVNRPGSVWLRKQQNTTVVPGEGQVSPSNDILFAKPSHDTPNCRRNISRKDNRFTIFACCYCLDTVYVFFTQYIHDR